MRAAKALARIAHAGQKYGTLPYFSAHVDPVAQRVIADPGSTPDHVRVAYLHDVVEDTEVTLDDLFDLGFSAAVCHAVKMITRVGREDYLTYIEKIAADDGLAALVKFHDLRENISNGGGNSEKYAKALAILKESQS